jgi:tetratricopeptide (TPR) repeat protein
VNPEHTIRNYTYSQPHNEWIGILSELGIFGFILSFIVFFFPPGIVFYRILYVAQKPRISSVFYASFIIGFYLFAFFDFPFRRVEHSVLLFSILAFLVGATGTSSSVAPVHGRKVPVMLFSLLFILLLALSFVVGSARIMGEYYTLKMFREERKNDAKVIEYCRKAENGFYRITPNTLPLAWFEGVACYRTGDAGTAVGCFSKAIQSTPYEVRVLNDYGIALYTRNMIKEGKALLLKSIEIDPFFDDAKFNLAAIYYYTGQKDSALYYVQRCRESQKKKDYLKEMN